MPDNTGDIRAKVERAVKRYENGLKKDLQRAISAQVTSERSTELVDSVVEIFSGIAQTIRTDARGKQPAGARKGKKRDD